MSASGIFDCRRNLELKYVPIEANRMFHENPIRLAPSDHHLDRKFLKLNKICIKYLNWWQLDWNNCKLRLNCRTGWAKKWTQKTIWAAFSWCFQCPPGMSFLWTANNRILFSIINFNFQISFHLIINTIRLPLSSTPPSPLFPPPAYTLDILYAKRGASIEWEPVVFGSLEHPWLSSGAASIDGENYKILCEREMGGGEGELSRESHRVSRVDIESERERENEEKSFASLCFKPKITSFTRIFYPILMFFLILEEELRLSITLMATQGLSTHCISMMAAGKTFTTNGTLAWSTLF